MLLSDGFAMALQWLGYGFAIACVMAGLWLCYGLCDGFAMAGDGWALWLVMASEG